MPATVNGGGDQLARGAVRVRFQASEKGTPQDKWDAIFGKDSGPKKNYSDDSNSDSTSARDAGKKPRKARKS